MNKQELIESYERISNFSAMVPTKSVIDKLKQLDESEKLIKLKDVIKRIQGFDDGTKFQWTYSILQELGSDFSSKIFHEAYQQGRFDEGMDAYYGRDKVEIPQFVADWYEENKDVFEANLYRCAYNIPSAFDSAKLNEFERWFLTAGTKPFQTLVNMHQFGYTVEEEKRYIVRLKNIREDHETLNCEKHSKIWNFSSEEETILYKTKHTRKELEEAGFGWVFDCEGIEVEEVE